MPPFPSIRLRKRPFNVKDYQLKRCPHTAPQHWSPLPMHITIRRRTHRTASAPTAGVLLQFRPVGPILNVLKGPMDSKHDLRKLHHAAAQTPEGLPSKEQRPAASVDHPLNTTTHVSTLFHPLQLNSTAPIRSRHVGQWCHRLAARSPHCSVAAVQDSTPDLLRSQWLPNGD